MRGLPQVPLLFACDCQLLAGPGRCAVRKRLHAGLRGAGTWCFPGALQEGEFVAAATFQQLLLQTSTDDWREGRKVRYAHASPRTAEVPSPPVRCAIPFTNSASPLHIT